MTATCKSIPLETGVFLLATHASWADADDARSQRGHCIMFADGRLEHEAWAAVSPLRRRSFKLERHTRSTLGSELMSLSRGIAECCWTRSLLAEALNEDYTLDQEKCLRERPRALITSENKPIFDHSQGDGAVVEPSGWPGP